MTISIIIPTLNEARFLPKLLESIKKQTFTDYEVIVADAGSKDKTLEIAKKYGARIVKGGFPAEGRNAGARAAKGDFLFFQHPLQNPLPTLRNGHLRQLADEIFGAMGAMEQNRLKSVCFSA